MTKAWYQETQAPADNGNTNREWTEAEITERHKDLLYNPAELTAFMKKRGLTEETVKRFKIGLFGPGVYMIPVYDANGRLLNMRYYRPATPAFKNKWGVKGKTTKLLYPLLGMNGANPLWIVEGEFDAMMAIQNGIHAVTTTAGAPATPCTLAEHANIFGPHRRFVLAFDNDEPGFFATAHIGLEVFPGRIDGVVRWPAVFQKDITDWYNQWGSTEDLEAMVKPWDQEWAISMIELEIQSYAKRDPPQKPPVACVALLNRLRTGGVAMPGLQFAEPAAAAPPEKHEDHGDAWEGDDDPPKKGLEEKKKLKDFDRATMWPSAGFLHEYIDFAAEQTDAPDQFHAATALTVYGTSTRRAVYFQMGVNRLYMNFYTVCVAPSSAFRKSTSLKIGGDLLYRMDPKMHFSREFSCERFLVKLAKDGSQGMMYFSEIAELLEQFKRSYSEGLLALLTDFFDCPAQYERETQKDGLQVIRDVFISILSASTVDWMNENITSKQAEGGFWPRFLFFAARNRTKPLLELPPEPNAQTRELLVYRLKAASAVTGRAILTPDAEARFRHWNRENDATSYKASATDALIKYTARLQAAALKMAILYQMSETSTLTVDDVSMERALALCDWLKEEYNYLYEYEFSRDKSQANEQKLIKIVRTQPGIKERDAMRSMHLPVNQFRQVLESCTTKEYVFAKSPKMASGRTARCLFPTNS